MNNSYCAIASKIKSMHSTNLTEEDYEQLLSKKTVAQLCSYLKYNTGYSGELNDVNDKDIHRLDLELYLEKEVRDEYVRLYKFMDLNQRKMLRFWFEREEIQFLKEAFRHILSGETVNVVKHNEGVSEFFKEHTKVDLELARNAKTFEDLVRACQNTIYYDVLARVKVIKLDSFAIEMMFDCFYYKSMWQQKDKYIPKKQIHYFDEFIGEMIDTLNILWIYRSKKYFNIENEIIYTYLIPVRYRLTEEDTVSIVGAKDSDEVINYIKNTKYSELFKNISEGFFVEENHTNMIYKTAKKIYKFAPDSMAGVFAYLKLKEIEIYNIKTIIEGIRYDFNPNTIKAHLCM